MAHVLIEQDRGYGWQMRAGGEIASDTPNLVERVKDQALRSALNGPVRAFIDGALVFETPKLTAKQARKLFNVG